MKYYIAIILTLLFVSSLLISYGVAEAKDTRPNILIIVTDDMPRMFTNTFNVDDGYRSPYGGHRHDG